MRVFLFTLAVLGMCVVAILPPAAALVLVHRYTHRRAWFWAWLVGLLAWIAVAVAAISAVTFESGLAEWVGP